MNIEAWIKTLLDDSEVSYQEAPSQVKDQFDRSLNDDLGNLHPDDDFQELWENFYRKQQSEARYQEVIHDRTLF